NGDADNPTDPESRGLIVYFTSAPALSWTDLPAKPLMLPLMQELVRQGVGRAHGAWTALAGAPVAAPGRVVELRPVGAEAGAPSAIVDETGRTSAPVRHAGLFRALDVRGVGRGLVA